MANFTQNHGSGLWKLSFCGKQQIPRSFQGSSDNWCWSGRHFPIKNQPPLLRPVSAHHPVEKWWLEEKIPYCAQLCFLPYSLLEGGAEGTSLPQLSGCKVRSNVKWILSTKGQSETQTHFLCRLSNAFHFPLSLSCTRHGPLMGERQLWPWRTRTIAKEEEKLLLITGGLMTASVFLP